jgi:hypothetical protein
MSEYEDQDVVSVTFTNPNDHESHTNEPVYEQAQQSQPSQVDYDDSPAFLFSVSEPEKKESTSGMKLSYWSYKLTCNVRFNVCITHFL